MQKESRPAGVSLKHTFVVALSLVLGGVLIWIIQLARVGDPIGYIILTGVGVLMSLPVVGLVLALLIGAIAKLQRPQTAPSEDVKTIYETQRVLRAQNQELARLLLQLQNNPSLQPGSSQAGATTSPVHLRAGQVITPEGFIIDGTAFNTLEEDDVEG